MELVVNFEEVVANAISFGDLRPSSRLIAADRIGQFFHWYYFPNIDVFAPSKFIGYKDTTIENYKGKGTGTDTQRVLKKWFHKLDRSTSMYRDLKSRLTGFVATFDQTVNIKTFEGTGGIYAPIGSLAATDYPDQITDEQYSEGAIKKVIVNAFERNPKARKACIDHWGTACTICAFDFSAVYGKLGEGFIHVHHLKELSEIGKKYVVDPIQDLRPLCPNCHAMVHREKPAIGLDALKKLIAR